MAIVRYVATGSKAPDVKVSASMNNGLSWQNVVLRPGQTFPIPPKCSNLLIDNVPYDPGRNYEIRDGRVGGK